VFKVAIDYSTAYVAVAYAVVEPGVQRMLQKKTFKWFQGIRMMQVTTVERSPNRCQISPGTCPAQVFITTTVRQQRRQSFLHDEDAPYRRVERAKLLLSKVPSTENARQALRTTTGSLMANGLIEAETDAIRHQLIEILHHTKKVIPESA
jgi:hypothetical protein